MLLDRWRARRALLTRTPPTPIATPADPRLTDLVEGLKGPLGCPNSLGDPIWHHRWEGELQLVGLDARDRSVTDVRQRLVRLVHELSLRHLPRSARRAVAVVLCAPREDEGLAGWLRRLDDDRGEVGMADWRAARRRLAILAVAPDEASIEDLERRYGENRLTPDPAGLGPPPGVPDDGVLHRQFGARPGLLNGLLNGDVSLIDDVISNCQMELALDHRDDPGSFAPGAADYASLSDDFRTVTIRLRKGIHWQFPAVDREDPQFAWLVERFERDPPELTAEDFRFTLELLHNPDVDAAGWRDLMDGTRIRILDRYTFQVLWDRFYVYAFETSVSWQVVLAEFLYSQDEQGNRFGPDEIGVALNTHWYNDRVCGYGPYAFVEIDPNLEIMLRRMDDFPVFRPALRELHFQIVVEPEQLVLRLRGEQIDLIALASQQYKSYVLDADDGSDFKGGRFEVQTYDKMNYLYFGWNCRKPPFDDARVRRAMTQAMNREALLDKIFFGIGEVIESHVYPRHPHCNTELPRIPYDLVEASRLLDEAGWDDSDGDGVRDKVFRDPKAGEERVDLRFTMTSFTSASYRAALAVFQDDLKRIGVDMSIEELPWAQMMERVFKQRDFDAFTGSWGLGWSVDLFPTFHSQGQSNYPGFSDPEADDLVVAYRETADDEKRREMALRLQEIIHQQQPYTFFFLRKSVIAYQPWLKNVGFRVGRPQLRPWSWYVER